MIQFETMRFTFALTRDELVSHFRDRAMYHLKRAAEKDAALPKLKEALDAVMGDKLSRASLVSNKSRYGSDIESEVQQLEQDIKNHRKSAAKFNWLADHASPDTSQVVSIDELNRFEFF